MTQQKNIPDSIEDPIEIFDDIVMDLDEKQKGLIKITTELGFTRDRLISIRPLLIKLNKTKNDDHEYISLVESNNAQLVSLHNQLNNLNQSDPNYLQNLHHAAGTANYFVNTSGSTAAFNDEINFQYREYVDVFPGIISLDDHDIFTRRLRLYDEALGKTYQEVWEALYGTQADPERVALYALRQTYDLFLLN